MSQSIDVLETPQMPSRLEQQRLQAEAAQLLVDTPANPFGVRNRLEQDPELREYYATLVDFGQCALRSSGYESAAW